MQRVSSFAAVTTRIPSLTRPKQAASMRNLRRAARLTSDRTTPFEPPHLRRGIPLRAGGRLIPDCRTNHRAPERSSSRSSRRKNRIRSSNSGRNGTDGGTRTHTAKRPRDFKSRASADSATSANSCVPAESIMVRAVRGFDENPIWYALVKGRSAVYPSGMCWNW